MAFPQDAGRCPLETVHKAGYGDFGRIVHQQMNVVVLAVKLDQLRFKLLANVGKHAAHILKNGFGEHMAAVFGHKDQMNMKIEYTVPPVSNIA